MKLLYKSIILIIPFIFFGCFESGLSGTYVGQEGAFFEKLTFVSNDKVELTFLGTTTEATYTKEGKKVKIDNAGENQILTITENGCLDGGGFIGKYCKE
ncbi:hypothetical protein ACFSKN_08595 [Mariniflexile gromovii]|uniref:Lipoprotein n=1 Tax=Mariniflexile gromovii TaxID=362523 RepID=A0ABS4BVQ3_9FLAO|nr:hypothetical protein [Mariniflexile gromovii]MBP0904091.1 hypothetical protein [Mariniflexile gromovii]